MTFRPILSALAALGPSLALPAQAASLRDCDTFEASARNLVFPVERSIRSFANGAIRVIGLDTGGEPVCCSAHVMVLLDRQNEPGQTCALISREGTMGWAGAEVGAARATYDPATGLRVDVPVRVYDGSGSLPDTLRIEINQATGRIAAR